MPLQKTYHTRPRVKSPPLRSLVSDSVWKPDTSKGSQITKLHPWKPIQERQVTPSRERSDKVTKHGRFSFSLWPEGSLSQSGPNCLWALWCRYHLLAESSTAKSRTTRAAFGNLWGFQCFARWWRNHGLFSLSSFIIFHSVTVLCINLFLLLTYF